MLNEDLPVPKPCCACARQEAATILINIGTSMKPVNTNEIIRHFMLTVKFRLQNFRNLLPKEPSTLLRKLTKRINLSITVDNDNIATLLSS